MFHSTPDPQTGTLIPASRIPMHYHSSLPQSAQIAAAWQGSVWDTQRGDKQEKVMLVSPAHAASHCQAWDGCCGSSHSWTVWTLAGSLPLLMFETHQLLKDPLFIFQIMPITFFLPFHLSDRMTHASQVYTQRSTVAWCSHSMRWQNWCCDIYVYEFPHFHKNSIKIFNSRVIEIVL